MIEICPVCGGNLVEEGRGRAIFSRRRRVVRCDSCQSVLRERGHNRWHYAVELNRNPEIYRRFNGKYLTDEELEALVYAPPTPPPRATPEIDVAEVSVPPALQAVDESAESLEQALLVEERDVVGIGGAEEAPPPAESIEAVEEPPSPAQGEPTPEVAPLAVEERADEPAAEVAGEPADAAEPAAGSAVASAPEVDVPPKRAAKARKARKAPAKSAAFEPPRFIENDDWDDSD